MLNRWLCQLRRNLFGPLDRVAPPPATTRIHRKSRSRCRLHIEELEARLAPATLSYTAATGELDFAASTTMPETIRVVAPTPSQLVLQVYNGDSITLSKDAVSNADFVPSTTNYPNDTLTIDTSGATINTFNVYLANQPISPDTLSFAVQSNMTAYSVISGYSTTWYVQNVNIGGPASVGSTPAPDTNDIVNLDTTSIGGALNVSAGTINVDGGTSVPYQGTVAIATDPSAGSGFYTITMPATGPGWAALGFARNDSITTAWEGNNNTGGINSIDGDTLTVYTSAQSIFTGTDLQNVTVTVNGANVVAANVTLNSASSLQTQSTAVSYLGNVTINAAPPAGQPYATYPYLTGPDWGAYGYQPGDTVTISSSAPEFAVTTANSNNGITTIADATTALENPNPTSYTEPVIDFNDNESFSDLHPFGVGPLPIPGADSTTPTESDFTNFVIQATANVYIPSAGTWTFGTNSDDGVQLMIGNNTVVDDDTTNSPTDTFGTYTATAPGLYPLNLVYFNHNGPGCIQLFAAQGNWNNFSAANFQLVGDTADGGLSITTVGSPSGYTVANTVGDNLYLVNSTSNPLPPGNYSGVTVAIASGTFTPQITASNSLSLNVTGLGNTITGAVAANDLAASTVNGNITLNVLDSVRLETIDAGTANIDLDAQGSILSGSPVAPATVNLEAESVDLTTTGTGSSIGSASALSADIAELTAATNDGAVFVANYANTALTIDSVVADQDGQAPTVNDDQIVYNSTPNQLIPTYAAGSSDVLINSKGPIILNSISATGSVEITALYLVEGNGQTPSIIAPTVDLMATGAANYAGEVTFANSSSGDTLTLPDTGSSWAQLGFAVGDPIVFSGATDTGNDGTFTVASISGYTLTLQQSNVLDPETEFSVSVGDGMIGLENSNSSSTSSSVSTAETAIELTEVGNFTAITTNGNIFLTLGGSVDSTAVDVDAGGTGNVTVTSQANFLIVEGITAPGNDVAVGMNSGALVEYPQGNGNPGIITGEIVALTSPLSIGTPSSPLLTNASSELSVTANATSPSSAAVYVDNTSNLMSLGVSTYDGAVAIYQTGNTATPLLSFSNNQLSASGNAVVSFANTDDNDGSNDDVNVNGAIDVSSITAGGRILAGTNALITGQAVTLSAGTGIGMSGHAIDTAVTALDASTNTGNIEIDQSAPVTAGSGATLGLTTDNGAITSVTLDSGGAGYRENSIVLLMVTGGGGSGGVVEAATNSLGVVTSIVSLVAANGGSTDVVCAGDGYTNTGATTSGAFMLLSASTSNGNINVRSSGGDDLILDGISTGSQNAANFTSDANIYYTTQVSSAAASGSSASTSSTSANSATLSGLSTGTLYLKATEGGTLGTASNPLNTSVTNVTATADGLFLSNNTSLTLTTLDVDIAGGVSISTIGNLTLNKAFLGAANSSVSLTATAGTLATTGAGGAIAADTLTISAEQIGSAADLIQTNAATIDATADYGGVYIDNAGFSPLTVTAGAVGPTNGGPTNNIDISSQGTIVLYPQTSTLPGAGTTPNALYSPGGTVTLDAGYVASTYDIVSVPGGTGSLTVGMAVSGAGIPAGDTIQALPGSDEIVLSAPATASGTNVSLIFTPLITATGAITGNTVSGLGSTTNSLTVGMPVSGLGIPAGDSIAQVNGSGEITLAEPGINTGGAVRLTFTPVITATGTVTGHTVTGLGGASSSLTSGMLVSGPGIPAGDTILQVNANGNITLALAIAESGSGNSIPLAFYSTQSTTATGATTGTPETTAGTPATYFDVYTGTLIIGNTTITNSASLLTGAGYGPLVTETNTAEVAVFAPIALANSGPLELTPTMLANGGTFTGSAITIEELGTQPQAINGNLVLEATGSIVFLDTTNSISLGAGFTITIEAGGVAALGNITTDDGDVTIEASGNVGIGAVNAGTGAVAIASSGSIFNSNGGVLSIQASQTNLAQAQIQVYGQGPSTAPSTGNLTQLQLQAAQAFATAAAASAQAAADQTTADAFQAELTSISATVASDNLTYQNDVTATNNANSIVNTDQNTVNYDTQVINGLTLAGAVASTVSAGLSLWASIIDLTGDTVLDIPEIGPISASVTFINANEVNTAANIANIISAGLSLASASESYTLYNDTQTLSTATNTLTTDQSAQDVAYAQLLADQDDQTAVAAAYSIADQAAVSEAIVAQQDQAVAQADSALVLAASEASSAQASAQTVAASVANATAQPLTVNGGPLTITGEAPSGSSVTNLTVSTSITLGYSIANIAANGSVWTVTTTAASGLAAGNSVTISGVTPTAYDGTWTVASASTLTAPYTFTIASTAAPGSAGYGGTAAAVPAGVTLEGNGSPMTVSANITAPGSIALAEPETASGGDNLSVSPGATVASEGSSVALAAGDDIDISSGATIQASSTISITADTNDGTYQGQMTFGSNTLTLPARGPTWTSLGFAPGGDITVSGSAHNNGNFIIAPGGISSNGYVMTLSNIVQGTGSSITVTDDTRSAEYGGKVTFAASASGDTLTMPTGNTWTGLNFAAGDEITVSGSAAAQNNGNFIIASAVGLTLTVTDKSLTQETAANVTVGATFGANDTGANVTAANVTVAGTLNATSALITVPSTSTRPATFNITPSATTPITVAGSGQGKDTLNVNFDTAGLAVAISETQTTTGTQTLSSGTIAAPGMQTITFTNIAAVTIIDAAGGAQITLNGNTLAANTMTLVGAAQGAGAVTLDNAPFSFSGVASFSYQGGGKGDTISVTPFATPDVPWDLAVTIAGGTGSPASLTYNSVASLGDTVTATGADAGVIGSPGLAAVQFSNVSAITANASQLPSDQLTVSLVSTFAVGVVNTFIADQTAAGDVEFSLNAFSTDFSVSSVGYGNVNLSDTTGTALFEVGVAGALEVTPTASANFSVVGSPVYKDHLLVQDQGGTKPTGSSDTITPGGIAGSGLVTVGALNPVTYQNISSVLLQPVVTVTDAGGTYNGKAFAATAKVLGSASLDKITPTLTYYSYSGAFTPTVNYYTETFTPPTGAAKLTAAPTNVGSYAAVATYAGVAGTYGPNWAWTTFTVSKAPAAAPATAARLTANAAPKVTKQPASQTVAVGTPVTFTVAASGTPAPLVQWMVSTGTGKPFTPIAGATALSYSFTPQAGDTGKRFEAVLTNAAGKITTSVATLTVDVPPGLLADPTNQTAVHGKATFSVVPTGTKPTVQWQVSTDGGNTWSNVKGATSATLTLTGLTSLESGRRYRVLVTNAIGTFTSGAATLSV